MHLLQRFNHCIYFCMFFIYLAWLFYLEFFLASYYSMWIILTFNPLEWQYMSSYMPAVLYWFDCQRKISAVTPMVKDVLGVMFLLFQFLNNYMHFCFLALLISKVWLQYHFSIPEFSSFFITTVSKTRVHIAASRIFHGIYGYSLEHPFHMDMCLEHIAFAVSQPMLVNIDWGKATKF